MVQEGSQRPKLTCSYGKTRRKTSSKAERPFIKPVRPVCWHRVFTSSLSSKRCHSRAYIHNADIALTRRQITIDSTSTTSLTANQSNLIEEWCISLTRKIHVFRGLQCTHMPGAIVAIRAEDDVRAAQGLLLPNPKSVKLWLPSDLPEADREVGCVGPLAAMEMTLREAQCYEGLDAVRNRLHAKQHLIHWRNKNVTGQYHSTRASSVGLAIISKHINSSTPELATHCGPWVAGQSLVDNSRPCLTSISYLTRRHRKRIER